MGYISHTLVVLGCQDIDLNPDTTWQSTARRYSSLISAEARSRGVPVRLLRDWWEPKMDCNVIHHIVIFDDAIADSTSSRWGLVLFLLKATLLYGMLISEMLLHPLSVSDTSFYIEIHLEIWSDLHPGGKYEQTQSYSDNNTQINHSIVLVRR